jgi:hypothetical protein
MGWFAVRDGQCLVRAVVGKLRDDWKGLQFGHAQRASLGDQTGKATIVPPLVPGERASSHPDRVAGLDTAKESPPTPNLMASIDYSQFEHKSWPVARGSARARMPNSSWSTWNIYYDDYLGRTARRHARPDRHHHLRAAAPVRSCQRP